MRPEIFVEKEVEELEKLSSEGNYGALYELARRYTIGDLIQTNEILEKYKKMNIIDDFSFSDILADKLYMQDYFLCKKVNDDSAKCYLGMLYYHNYMSYEGNLIEYFEELSEKGLALATEFLGRIYYYGKGVEKDYQKAKYYFELCTEKDELYGRFLLGRMYYYGEGVEINYQKAKEYFESSTKDSISNYYLGIMYYKAKGVTQDYQKAKYYFEACRNDIMALYYIGDMYLNGLGVQQDKEEAEKYFLKIEKRLLKAFVYLNVAISDDVSIKTIIQMLKYKRKYQEALFERIPKRHLAMILYKRNFLFTEESYNYLITEIIKKLEKLENKQLKFNSESDVEKFVNDAMNY